MILAEAAAQSTSAEKYSAASPGAADAGFFPVVQCGSGSYRAGGSLAETSLDAAVNAAHAGAELAMVNLFLEIGYSLVWHDGAPIWNRINDVMNAVFSIQESA